jgi:hypothetical protein
MRRRLRPRHPRSERPARPRHLLRQAICWWMAAPAAKMNREERSPEQFHRTTPLASPLGGFDSCSTSIRTNYAAGESCKAPAVERVRRIAISRALPIPTTFSTVSTKLVPGLVHIPQRSVMTPSDLPHLTIEAVGPHCLTGRYQPSEWVGDGWIGAIHFGGSRFIWGRFRSVDPIAYTCSFCPDRASELSELRPGTRYPFIDGYWGERAELVLDRGRQWQRNHFEPSDMVRFPAGGCSWMATRLSAEAPRGGVLVPGGWDHEHCDVCQKTIGCGGEPFGYSSPPNAWVCEKCYASFVVPRSLAFISDS